MSSLIHCLVLSLCLAGLVRAQTNEETRRYEFLRAEVARHDELYFRKGTPAITDAAYDRLRQELDTLAGKYPHLAQQLEKTAIGDDRTGVFPTQPHLAPMLSLRKARTEQEVDVFDNRLRALLGDEMTGYVVEPKYDGVALSIVYEDGRLMRAVTRGNGLEGDVVTENARALLDLPDPLPTARPPRRLELRGEAYVTFAQFVSVNQDREAAGEPPFSHPRALAAGTLKLLDDSERAHRRLSFVAHGWGAWIPLEQAPRSQGDFRTRLDAWGVPMVENLGAARTAEELWTLLQRWDVGRRTWAFPTDGVVVKLDRTEARLRAGEGESAPNWALAFKFAAETVVTRVLDVTWQVGRTGAITPVAELEPVDVRGITVSRASLHSPAHVARLDVRAGDRVEVERAGEVIPRILAVRNETGYVRGPPFESPKACPSCQSSLEHDPGAGHLRCLNFGCTAQVERRLEHYVSASAADIRGFGPAILHTLVAQGSLRSPGDLYRLGHDDLVRAGAGASAGGLLEQVEKSRSAETWRVIYGLGIPRVGAVTSRIVADLAGDLAGLIELGRQASSVPAPDLSAGVRSALAHYFENPEAVALVNTLHSAGVGRRKLLPENTRSDVLSGHVVVFTGALGGMTRDQAAEEVRAAGGRVSSSITSRTTLVVAGDGAGSKLETARRLGVRVIGEGEFRKLLAGFPSQANQR